jgi:Family of unknown function (DUF6130)
MRRTFIGLIGVAAVLCASTAMAQTARDIRGPAPVVPLANEPAPRIVIDPPVTESLVHGRVVIQYRAENLRIVPVFGPNALDVSPRIELVDANHQTPRQGDRHLRDPVAGSRPPASPEGPTPLRQIGRLPGSQVGHDTPIAFLP